MSYVFLALAVLLLFVDRIAWSMGFMLITLAIELYINHKSNKNSFK